MEGGVVGHHVNVGGVGRSERRREVSFQNVVDLGVVEPYGQVEATFAGCHDVPSPEELKGHIPQPGRVVAVSRAGVDGDDDRRRGRGQHVENLGPAGRVLGQ